MGGFSFLIAVMDWLQLPLSMPFPHNFRKIFYPKYHPPWASSRERKIYSDIPYDTENEAQKKGENRLFRPSVHRKYNSRFCFVNQQDEVDKLTKCISEVDESLQRALLEQPKKTKLHDRLRNLKTTFEQRLSDLQTLCTTDPRIQEPFHKSASSKKGYTDFLRSLEVIGMQEYIKREHTGGSLLPEAQNKLLERMNEDGWKKRIAEHDEQVIDKDDLHDLARWERTIQLRDYAEIRNKWFKNLSHRSTCKSKMRSDLDIDECDEHPAPNNKKYPGIRRKTFWLLTRPIEPDWNLLLVLSYFVAIGVYCLSLGTQLFSLVTTCAGPYMCPLMHIVDNNPIIAPPLAFRQPSDQPYFHTSRWRYYPEAIQSCTLGAAGCSEPGYRVQWPLMQNNASDPSLVSFPPDLEARCPRRELGADWYTWDPFNSKLMTEYYDCESVACEGEQDCQLPFEAIGPDGSTTWMHFDISWYAENRRATVECLESLIENDIIDNLAEAVALVGQRETQRAKTFMRRMDQCVSSDRTFTIKASSCKCREGYTEWPVALYHDEEPVRTCQTDVPYVSGTVCKDDSECDDGKACRRKWSDSQPIAGTDTYGCFFRSPLADEPVPTDYFTCGFSVEQQIIRSTTAEPLLSRQQVAIEVDVTKKTGLLVFFMLKEGGVLTACIFTTAIIALLIIALAIPALIVVLISIAWMSLVGDHLENVKNVNTVFIYVHEAYVFVLHVLYSLLLNMSTTYRIYKLLRSIASGQTNASLEDLNRKVTNLMNILLNLAILVFADTDVNENTLLVASISLSFILVLFQMQLEKESLEAIASALKDLNENRLSKFEIALVVHKLMEDFLSDDVQFLWTKHLVSQEEGLLIDELREFEDSKDLERTLKQDKDTFNDEIEKFRPSYLCPPSVQDEEAREMDIDQSFPLLPKDLAQKFGHDARFEFLPSSAEEPELPRRRERRDRALWGREADSALLLKARDLSKTDGLVQQRNLHLKKRAIALPASATLPGSPRVPAGSTTAFSSRGVPGGAVPGSGPVAGAASGQRAASSAASTGWPMGLEGAGAFEGMMPQMGNTLAMSPMGVQPGMQFAAHGNMAYMHGSVPHSSFYGRV